MGPLSRCCIGRLKSIWDLRKRNLIWETLSTCWPLQIVENLTKNKEAPLCFFIILGSKDCGLLAGWILHTRPKVRWRHRRSSLCHSWTFSCKQIVRLNHQLLQEPNDFSGQIAVFFSWSTERPWKGELPIENVPLSKRFKSGQANNPRHKKSTVLNVALTLNIP